MGKCSSCGVEMKENAKFCKSCGSDASLQGKKARVMNQEKNWMKPAAIAAVLVLALGAGVLFMQFRARGAGANPMFPPHRDASSRVANAVMVKAENGDVRIPVKTVEDGNAHFFAFAAGGKTIRFFIMKGSDGNIRTAFDACVACNHAKLGYRQEGALVVCNNCGMGFAPADIGKQTGGCNPIPVQKTEDGQMIVLKAKDLEAGAQYF